MSTLSRTFARAYVHGEKAFKQAQEIKKRRRAALKAAPVIPVTADGRQRKESHARQQ